MPANSKAGDQLSSDQKTALRWDQQADHAARTQLYPAPDADRDTDMQDLWLETLHSERQQKRPGLCGPCPDLDSSIFILRLLVMGAMLRAVLDRRNLILGIHFDNHGKLLEKAYLLRAIGVSLEITDCYAGLDCSRIFAGLDHCLSGACALATIGTFTEHSTFLKLLDGALILLDSGASPRRADQQCAGGTRLFKRPADVGVNADCNSDQLCPFPFYAAHVDNLRRPYSTIAGRG